MKRRNGNERIQVALTIKELHSTYQTTDRLALELPQVVHQHGSDHPKVDFGSESFENPLQNLISIHFLEIYGEYMFSFVFSLIRS